MLWGRRNKVYNVSGSVLGSLMDFEFLGYGLGLQALGNHAISPRPYTQPRVFLDFLYKPTANGENLARPCSPYNT